MIKVLLAACAGLAITLAMVWLRLDTVSIERDGAVKVAKQLAASAESLRGTLRLQRELANDQAAIEATYLEEKQRAEDRAEYLRRCLADGSCGLRVAATCPSVRVGPAGAAAGEPDAGAPELTAAARRAYPTLVAGLKDQRAQIVGLQDELRLLHSQCKLAP
ncbi:lysis system i-spanin subunit Rz [Pseudomonas sp. NPDC077649]|uniref:lysis system i-spanin subunit Rz n=1 Tax=Pseudomonas sp. NPDC077649 TaxID=3364423 RepID=UPI0037C52932